MHRIERGEPSVAMGSYVSAAAAVGLELQFVDPNAEPPTGTEPSAALPPNIHVADYPQLARLAWQLPETANVTLDAPKLAAHHCPFGGGTAMVLHYGEYRESVIIYFPVPDFAGYRAQRQALIDALGVRAIARSGAMQIATREVRADQYGIRTMLEEDGVQIKFEIVLEACIDLEQPPANAARICDRRSPKPRALMTRASESTLPVPSSACAGNRVASLSAWQRLACNRCRVPLFESNSSCCCSKKRSLFAMLSGKEKAPQVVDLRGFCLVALHGFEPRTCGL
ncbi:MAG: hypothetical protein JWQ41_2157 [Variovorax sp.]|nr:hypothetical protein [Variovorax sp.]